MILKLELEESFVLFLNKFLSNIWTMRLSSLPGRVGWLQGWAAGD